MTNYFESPFKGIPLDQQVTHPTIIVERYSYYSGYYHGHSFDDCARYLLPDKKADQLISSCFWFGGAAAAIMTAGHPDHRDGCISSLSFLHATDPPLSGGAGDGHPPGDHVVVAH